VSGVGPNFIPETSTSDPAGEVDPGQATVVESNDAMLGQDGSVSTQRAVPIIPGYQIEAEIVAVPWESFIGPGRSG